MATQVSASLLTLEEKKLHAASAADVAALYAAFALLTAKLDADGGVTDTNFTALCTPAAQTLVP